MNRRYPVAVLLLGMGACRGTEPFVAVPTSIAVAPAVASLNALGATRQLTAAVLDQRGDTIRNVSVQWTTLSALVASVDGTGLVTAQGVGTTQVQARFSQSTTTLTSSATVTVTLVPRRLLKLSGDGLTDTVSATLQAPVAVRVEDSLGHPISGIPVAFQVTGGGGSISAAADTTDGSGLAAVTWRLGGSPGANTLSASITGSSVTGNPAAFSATAVAAGTVPTLTAFAGDAQTGLVGFAVNVPPAVRLRAAGGAPIAGSTVVFTVTSGGGRLTGDTALTDATGVARAGSWSLTAGTNTISARVVGATPIQGNPVTFTATGAPKRYHVDVRFLTPMTQSQQAAFTNAASAWETLIYGDVSDIPVSLPDSLCADNAPAMNETVDDVVILASVDSIDGAGSILGRAGPCLVRVGSRFPLLGVMEFDVADVAALEAAGQFDLVIAHEMGHVLGFGTIWTSSLLIGAGTSDPHFVGVQALAAFDRVGGTSYTGAKVPVENTGGGGTRDAHWRESVLGNELMTGFLDGGGNPLSVLSTASMGDLGYLVNYAGSDPFVITAALAARPTAVRAFGDDILRLPLIEVDAAGRVVRVVWP